MYRKPDSEIWQGRVDHATDHSYFRYHQIIQLHRTPNQQLIGLIGFSCDEGVRRNNGRIG
ncbi:hypothetical protein [Ureibacillus acetophenoni]